MADTTRKVLRINRVNGDGKSAPATVTLVLKDPVTGEELRNADDTPAVFIRLRPLPEEERKKIIATHTHLEKDPSGGRGLFEHVDANAANDEILQRTIEGWEGLAGADDRPLVCTDQTKLCLDAYIRGQVMKKAFGAEVAEVLAASFR